MLGYRLDERRDERDAFKVYPVAATLSSRCGDTPKGLLHSYQHVNQPVCRACDRASKGKQMRPHSGIDMSFWGRTCFTIEI